MEAAVNVCYEPGMYSSNRSYMIHITKTYLYNFDPLKPHFYIEKLGFTGVYIIFLISAQKHRLWYSLIYVFKQKYEKIAEILSENFQFLEVKFSIYLNRHVFVMTGTAMRYNLWVGLSRKHPGAIPGSSNGD